LAEYDESMLAYFSDTVCEYYVFVTPTDFSALHGMPARTSDEKGVHLFVCQTRAL